MPTGAEMPASEAAFGNRTQRQKEKQKSQIIVDQSPLKKRKSGQSVDQAPRGGSVSPRGGTSEIGMSVMPTGSEMQAAEAAFGNPTQLQNEKQKSQSIVDQSPFEKRKSQHSVDQAPRGGSVSPRGGTSEMGMSVMPTGSEVQLSLIDVSEPMILS